MLSPDFLINNIDDITTLYSDLHTDMLVSIVTHMADTLKVLGKPGIIPSVAYQIEQANQVGVLEKVLVETIAKANKMGRKAVLQLFKEAKVKIQDADLSTYKKAGVDPVPVYQSPTMLKIFDAGVNKTLGSVKNFTGSTIGIVNYRFLELTNLAYNKITSGAFSYDQAIAGAVDELGREGVYSLMTATGHKISLEAGVRRAVLTGVSQTAGHMTHQALIDTGADLCRTSAHQGARNEGVGYVNHEMWQGKVFSLKSKTDKYEVFTDACGYGHVQGIYGANCKHSHGLYIEGISPEKYEDGQLDRWARETVTFEGKQIPYYAATQMLRAMERQIRGWKRREKMKDAAGFDASVEKLKVSEWQDRATDFVRQTKLQRQFIRERIENE